LISNLYPTYDQSVHLPTGCSCAFDWMSSFCCRLPQRLQFIQIILLQAASAPFAFLLTFNRQEPETTTLAQRRYVILET
jgi:hypothetical protein